MLVPNNDIVNEESCAELAEISMKGKVKSQSLRTDPAASTEIASKENRAVTLLRIVVLLVLLGSTAAVAALAYTYSTYSERDRFEEAFFGDAEKVFTAMGRSLDLTFSALDVCVASIVSYAKATNATWPFVTIPDVAVRAKKMRSVLNAVHVTLYPAVTNESLLEWESYTAR